MLNFLFSTEIVHKVYNDSTGEHIDIGHDTGDDLLEIRQVENEKVVARIVGQPEQMRLVAEALLKLTQPKE